MPQLIDSHLSAVIYNFCQWRKDLPSRECLQVDEYSRSVSTPSVFAIGDVANRIPLTPVARMEGNMLASYLFG